MAVSLEEKRAYAKGYHAGQNRRWPLHQPPEPPNEIVARLMKALQDLRDVTEGVCATLDESDEFVIQLNPMIDEATEALAAVTEWLKDADLSPHATTKEPTP